jgi:hypothetical protein
MIVFTSYSKARWIVFHNSHTTTQHGHVWIKDSTLRQTCYDLDLHHNFFFKTKKCFNIFITSCCMLYYKKTLASNSSKFFVPFEIYSNSTSMMTILVIDVIKALDNS